MDPRKHLSMVTAYSHQDDAAGSWSKSYTIPEIAEFRWRFFDLALRHLKMAAKGEVDESLGARLDRVVSAFLTALPITLISLASCVSYAHLMEPIGGQPPISLSLLSF